ncbi:imidazolonepropionase [Faecalibacterium gallinarum]|uniref:imidazolonepropionase n=1 Tax=Faecalibacterium gallinarum TaxID=2903556 RepID=UPI001EE34259|nr:imidazolonepropionase [Faecalibacterium gallinarum]
MRKKYSNCEIREKLGFTHKEMRGFLTRYNRKQRKLAEGIPPKPKGRPKKIALDPTSIEYYKAENERLKMENELLRDFLQFIERE